MTEDQLEILRSLASRPTRELTPTLKPKVIKLLDEGCVTYGPYGWIATPVGCALLERLRTKPH
jgi:hypothetical protein